jgi:hypothetical protein
VPRAEIIGLGQADPPPEHTLRAHLKRPRPKKDCGDGCDKAIHLRRPKPSEFGLTNSESSGRFVLYGWRLNVYINFLALTATPGELATEEEKRSGNDDHKDYYYRHHCCGAAATTIVISHKIRSSLK